ncbi:MAG: hypothetical protein ABR553_09660 [Gammaproteobacteria bacterium]
MDQTLERSLYVEDVEDIQAVAWLAVLGEAIDAVSGDAPGARPPRE